MLRVEQQRCERALADLEEKVYQANLDLADPAVSRQRNHLELATNAEERGAPAVAGPADGGYIAIGVAVAALAPFLQAVATAMGTRVGERLDDATRERLRRVLRRQIPRQSDDRASMFLATSSGRTRIQVEAAMPETALELLLSMNFEELEAGSDIAGLVRWTQAGWLATVVRSQQLEDLLWDAERQAWTPNPPQQRPAVPPS